MKICLECKAGRWWELSRVHRDLELKKCDTCEFIVENRKKVLQGKGSMVYKNGTWIVQEVEEGSHINLDKMNRNKRRKRQYENRRSG
jgi:hypothetical protein